MTSSKVSITFTTTDELIPEVKFRVLDIDDCSEIDDLSDDHRECNYLCPHEIKEKIDSRTAEVAAVISWPQFLHPQEEPKLKKKEDLLMIEDFNCCEALPVAAQSKGANELSFELQEGFSETSIVRGRRIKSRWEGMQYMNAYIGLLKKTVDLQEQQAILEEDLKMLNREFKALFCELEMMMYKIAIVYGNR